MLAVEWNVLRDDEMKAETVYNQRKIKKAEEPEEREHGQMTVGIRGDEETCQKKGGRQTDRQADTNIKRWCIEIDVPIHRDRQTDK